MKARFVHTNTLISKVIQSVTHGWPSHCEVWTDEGWLGAQPDGGVRIRPFDYLGSSIVRVEHVTMALADAHEVYARNFLLAQIGKPYDLLAVSAFVFGANWRMPNHWFCSDLIDTPLEACRYIPARSPPNRVSPARLLDDILNINNDAVYVAHSTTRPH